ncbi:hypothetical protein E2562_000459 [Oryza meyeriana var. granulata]|uniref:Uncharacterized protein n=1 Tax=Oryza meyeriana var. granulata TaxID=110450 RepID=A0A6G1CCL2_9ORYZ|nr:hypothetical protein E2562_000459 [Oryza meyeriana var. granulata]
MVVLLYVLAPRWLKVNLRFRPENGMIGAIWAELRQQALDRFHSNLVTIAAAGDGSALPP